MIRALVLMTLVPEARLEDAVAAPGGPDAGAVGAAVAAGVGAGLDSAHNLILGEPARR